MVIRELNPNACPSTKITPSEVKQQIKSKNSMSGSNNRFNITEGPRVVYLGNLPRITENELVKLLKSQGVDTDCLLQIRTYHNKQGGYVHVTPKKKMLTTLQAMFLWSSQLRRKRREFV